MGGKVWTAKLRKTHRVSPSTRLYSPKAWAGWENWEKPPKALLAFIKYRAQEEKKSWETCLWGIPVGTAKYPVLTFQRLWIRQHGGKLSPSVRKARRRLESKDNSAGSQEIGNQTLPQKEISHDSKSWQQRVKKCNLLNLTLGQTPNPSKRKTPVPTLPSNGFKP